MDNVDRCVCCNAAIPEGRQVCEICEHADCLHIWLFDQIVTGESGERYLSWKCAKCGRSRVDRHNAETQHRSMMFDG